MQRVLLKGSQLCSSKGVYVRNTAKPKHGAIQQQGSSLWLSLIMQVNDSAVSQLHTHARWVSGSAGLHPEGLPKAVGPVPFPAWGGGSRAKTRG